MLISAADLLHEFDDYIRVRRRVYVLYSALLACFTSLAGQEQYSVIIHECYGLFNGLYPVRDDLALSSGGFHETCDLSADLVYVFLSVVFFRDYRVRTVMTGYRTKLFASCKSLASRASEYDHHLFVRELALDGLKELFVAELVVSIVYYGYAFSVFAIEHLHASR